MARLISVNVGLPRDIAWRERLSTPACGRRRFQARAWCDGSISTATGKGTWPGTGASTGPSSSIRSTPIAIGRASSQRNDFTYGQFGENFTVDGLSDQEVCIGDRYRVGSALFEVTQPRVTCYRVGIRMNEPRMAALLVAHGRPGFYFRVLEEGEVEAGDEIVQVAAGPERMSVAEINALLYMPGHPREPAGARAAHPGAERRLARLPPGAARAAAEAARRPETPGLAPASGQPPAWTGFRPLRVARKIRESRNVISLVLEPADGLASGGAACPASSSCCG